MEKKKETVKERSATGEVVVQKNIETILRLEKENLKTRSTAEQIANKVTTFAGSRQTGKS